MRLTNPMPEEESMVFYWCNNCGKLAPMIGDPQEDLLCLVCGLSVDLLTKGRSVIFTKDEAEIRNLVWRTT